MSTQTAILPKVPTTDEVLKNARVNLGPNLGTRPEDYVTDLQKARVNIGGGSRGMKPEDLISDPAPFDVDGEFGKWLASQPIEAVADRHDAFSRVLHTLSRPFVAQGYNTLAAMNRANATLFAHLDLAADFVGRKTGAEKGGLFEDLAKTYDGNAAYYRHKAEQNGLGFIDELVSDAVGSAIPSVAQFMLDLHSGLTLPYMAGSEQAYQRGDNPLAGGLVEAARTGTLGAVFRFVGPLNTYLRAPVMGTVGGLQAMEEAPEGQKLKEFAKGFVTMGAFSLTSPGGRLGLNEIYENARPMIERASATAKEGAAGWVNLVDRVRQSELEPGFKTDIRERLFDESGFLALPGAAERESVYQNVVNRFASIENLDEKAAALGVTIKPGESLRMRSRGYLGIGGKVDSVLRDKTFRIGADGKIQLTGEGLKPILDDYERLSPETDLALREQEFNDYFTATRTIEDLQRPKGDWTTENIVTPQQVADAQAVIAELKVKYPDLGQFDAVAERLYAYQRRVLHSLVDSGNLSEAQYQQIVGENPHYVPFERVMEHTEAGTGGPRAKKPFTETRAPVKRIRGSELEIEDVAGSIIKNTYRTLDVAERNTVFNLVRRLSSDGESDAPQPYWDLGIFRVRVPVHAIRVSPEEIDTITRTFRSQTQEVKREVKESITAGGAAPTATTAPMLKLEGIVKDSLKARGFTDGEAASALEQIKKAAAKAPVAEPGATQTRTIENTIDRIVKETVQLITVPTESQIWRPSPYKPKGRIIEGYVKGKKAYIDVPENLYEAMSGMNEVSAGLMTRILSAPAALLRAGTTLTPDFMLRNFIRDNVDAYIQSTTGFRPFVDSVGAIADVIGRSDLYYDWLRSGAAHSTFVELSRGGLEKIVDELKNDPSAWRYLNLVADARKISLGIEEATRLGIYKAAKRHGKSDIEAMFAAREGTVDFGVHGQSRELKQFSSATAFFNPGIQGLDRFIRAHTEHPVGTALKSMAAVTIPSIVLWMVNKDDPDYKEKPQWWRDLFWNVKVGDESSFIRWISIPKPFAIGMLYGSVVERFLDFVFEKDPKALKGLVGSIIDSATPVSGDPNGIFLPTFLRPIIENATNWQFFKERQVVPQSRTGLLPELQYGKYTAETAKIIGERLGMSPAKVENLIQGWTGGTGKYSLDALDMAIAALTGEKTPKRPIEAADIPVLKAFVGRPVESDPQSLRDFYEESREIEAAYMSFRDQMKNLKLEKANRILRDHPKLLLSPTISAMKDRIAGLDKIIEVFAGTEMDTEEKRNAIRAIEQIRLRTAQLANSIMEGKPKTETTGEQTMPKDSVEELKKAATRKF